MGLEGAVAVGYIGPLIWLDSVGSSFIHYIYKVKGYIYCLTGWKANERGCHRYIDYLFTIKTPGDLLIFSFIEISFRRIPLVLNISTGTAYAARAVHSDFQGFGTLKMWYGLFVQNCMTFTPKLQWMHGFDMLHCPCSLKWKWEFLLIYFQSYILLNKMISSPGKVILILTCVWNITRPFIEWKKLYFVNIEGVWLTGGDKHNHFSLLLCHFKERKW